MPRLLPLVRLDSLQVIELARYFSYAMFEITPLSGAIYAHLEL